MYGLSYEEFKSQLIRSIQDAHGIDSPEVKECRRIDCTCCSTCRFQKVVSIIISKRSVAVLPVPQQFF